MGDDWGFCWFQCPAPNAPQHATVRHLVKALWAEAKVVDPPAVKLTCEGAILHLQCPLSVLQPGSIVRIHPPHEDLTAHMPTELTSPAPVDAGALGNALRSAFAGLVPQVAQQKLLLAASAAEGGDAKQASRNARRKKQTRQARREARLAHGGDAPGPRRNAALDAAGPSAKAPKKAAGARKAPAGRPQNARKAPPRAASSSSESSSESSSSSSEGTDADHDVPSEAAAQPTPPPQSPPAAGAAVPELPSPTPEPDPTERLAQELGANEDVPNAPAVEQLPQATLTGACCDSTHSCGGTLHARHLLIGGGGGGGGEQGARGAASGQCQYI